LIILIMFGEEYKLCFHWWQLEKQYDTFIFQLITNVTCHLIYPFHPCVSW
jgi:hypothetical protein